MSTIVIRIIFACLLVIGIAFTACQQSSKEAVLPAPAEYRSWKTTTDDPLNYPIPGHLDHFRIIYINAIGESVRISEKNGRQFYNYPEGTIVIKEMYQGLEQPEEGEEPINLTIMIKNSQSRSAKNGWLWISAKFGAEHGTLITHDFCSDCHANANEPHPYGDTNTDNDFRDFVFFPPQKK